MRLLYHLDNFYYTYKVCGTPDRNRTYNLILRTDLLYPVELPRRLFILTGFSLGFTQELLCTVLVTESFRNSRK